MVIFKTTQQIRDFRSILTSQKKTVGFVPTMGALHAGHISLIQESKKQCNITICSIFVNPTQFNDKADLERYPRTPEADIKLLEQAGCDVVFMPAATEMYPEPDTRTFDFSRIDKVLDGAHRPGHFNGVAQIVSKLFEIIKPSKAFFGQKDFQQVLIIKAMVKQLGLDVEIIPCPILREADGLAMSSRNTLLTPEERHAAKLIPKLMQEAKIKAETKIEGLKEIEQHLLEKVKTEPLLKPDYIMFCDAETLQPVSDLKNKKVVCLAAIFSGRIRLIDNILIN